MKDKWNPAARGAAGYDIGMERAIREWLQRNYLVWAPEDDTNGSNPAGSTPPANPPA